MDDYNAREDRYRDYRADGPSPETLAADDAAVAYKWPVRFSIGDDNRTFRGFTDGQTWNGFAEVYVTRATRDAIAAYIVATLGEDDAAESLTDLGSMPLVSDGLVDMVGWTTIVPTREARLRRITLRAAERHARRIDNGASDTLLRESDHLYRALCAAGDAL